MITRRYRLVSVSQRLIWASQRFLKCSAARERNRFSPHEDYSVLQVPRGNEWGLRVPRVAEDSTISELREFAGAQSDKGLERAYDLSNIAILDGIDGSPVGSASLARAAMFMTAFGELGKVRYLISELQRADKAELLNGEFFKAILNGVSKISLPSDIFEFFCTDICTVYSKVPEALYCTMITILIAHDAIQELRVVLSEFEEAHPSPSEVGHQHMMQAYLHLKQGAAAWRIFEALKARGLPLHVDVLKVAMHVAAMEHDLAKAEEVYSVYNHVLSLGKSAVEAYIMLLIKNNQLEHALLVYNNEKRRKHVSDEALHQLFAALVEADREDLAMQMLSREQLEDDTKLVFVQTVILGCVRKKKLREALRLMSFADQFTNTHLWNSVVDTLRSSGDLKTSDKLEDALGKFQTGLWDKG
ncbi:hypothetical protein NDN08_005289 [Rhodosorus marinus]|uniref:Pentacotripeptide-repeat region of PRORP domain-containing protein n=1 Tax=Rhodosorus marinus TaxID=101924 RepID=A0AAV8V180_9RHOD|nr:hypothetical protein NDN08_005289 [Rhodosorus marinus]